MPARKLLPLTLALLLSAASAAGAAPADETPPVITRTVTGTSGDAGWWVSEVNVRWTVSDPESTWTTQGCEARTVAEDTRGEQLECRATSAGGTSANGLTVRVDREPPAVTGARPDRPADHAGWYNRPVGVAFSGEDAMSGVSACTAATYAGPDGSHAEVTGTCRDVAGNASAPLAFAFPYDATAPDVLAATPARPPDRADGGWYLGPVDLAVTGVDAVSGLVACPPFTYSGPDGAPAAALARCVDGAGNVGTRPFPLAYDATPPRMRVRVVPGDRHARLRWRPAPDTRRVRVLRAPGRRGRARSVVYRGTRRGFTDRGLANGRRYRYLVVAVDHAGRRARRAALATPGRRLLAPRWGARLRRPPRLTWTPILGAGHYHVQLYRGSRLVLARWPRAAALRVPRAWRFQGRRHRLRAGRYRWFVWSNPARRGSAGYSLVGRRAFRFVVRRA